MIKEIIRRLPAEPFKDLLELPDSSAYVVLRQVFDALAKHSQEALNKRSPVGNFTDADFIAIGGYRKILDINDWLQNLDVILEKESKSREAPTKQA